MQRLPAFFLALLSLVLLGVSARAAPSNEQYFSVLLDGRKLGEFVSTRASNGNQVETTQTLELTMDRAGTSIHVRTREVNRETIDGKPLSFESTTSLSGGESMIRGTISDGVLHVTRSNGSKENTERSMAWPDGALLAEGLRLAGLKVDQKAGSRYRLLAFQAASLDSVWIDGVIGETTAVALPDGDKRLTENTQILEFPGAPMTVHAWLDADGMVWKQTIPIFGVEVTMLACDRACAEAPNQTSDVFSRMLMHAPRVLAARDLAADGLRYELIANGEVTLPQTDEQHVRTQGKAIIVDILRRAPIHTTTSDAESAPNAADSASTEWLQSSAPEIVALARKASAGEIQPLQRMRRLETFVRSFIANKNLNVGYASALEVAHKPEGDCTEHAVLLAALGRALEIPTRVVTGLVYAPQFAGRDRVFVPHAWVQAWINDRWQSFDAALNGFDASHIALSVGDGDPWRFYAGINALGNLHLQSVEALNGNSREHDKRSN
ncbi:MAG: transglutaminase-like domain-containing protein [Dokdonella sp.]